jgi:hypothetical protein
MDNRKAANPLSQIAGRVLVHAIEGLGSSGRKLDWNLSASNTVAVADDCTLAQ